MFLIELKQIVQCYN